MSHYCTIKASFVMILVLGMLIGCKKEETPEKKEYNCILSRVETGNANEEGITVMDVIYDSSDRVSRYEWSDGNYVHIAYDSNGLVEKMDILFKGRSERYSYTWDGNVATRKLNNSSSYNVFEFNNNNELIYYAIRSEYSNTTHAYITYIWANGNLTHKDTFYEGKQDQANVYTYDNKRNPFHNQKHIDLIPNYWKTWFHSAQNNITTWDWKSYTPNVTAPDGSSSQVLNFSIEYNEYDYPVKINFPDGYFMIMIYERCE